ncbi:hypothetical protein EAF00_004170 [Botryotinia globosa]|nr:hypothetical protein EAF00_004170 [Botryotinia globosa]
MDESRKVKPTAEKIDHLMGEMKLLTQEMLGNDAYTRCNDDEFVDQNILEEYNVAVADLEDRRNRATATLNEDELAETKIIAGEYSLKLQVLEVDFDMERDDLDQDLAEKKDRYFKRNQEAQAKIFLQKCEEKAKDILLSQSPEQENAIPTLGSDLAIPGTATGAAVDSPSTSFAGESTMPVSRTESVIQGQYLVASPDGNQSLFVDSPEFEPRIPSPVGDSVDSSYMTASLGFEPSRNADHSIKRQKTKALPSTLIKRERSPSMNDPPYLRDRLLIQVPTKPFNMASDKPFGSHAQSRHPSVHNAGRDCGLGRENAATSQNDFVPRNSVSTRFQPAFAQQPFASRPTLDFSNGLFPFAQTARQGYSSSQISSPFMGASRYASSNAGLTDNASKMGEKQRTDYRKGHLMTPLKRKASDSNLNDLYDATNISKTGAPIQIQKKPDGVSKFRAVRPSATNSSSASGASRNWSGQAPQFGRQEGIKEEPASEVTGVFQSINVESAQISIPVNQPSYVEAMQSNVLTPRHSNVGPSGRTITGTGSSSSESSGPVAVTYKLIIPEAQRYILVIPIEYISYDAGTPSRSFPVTWSGKKGIQNPGQHVGENYSLQVKLRKNGVLHPYDGADDKAAQYPMLVVDGSWILGGFCHRKSGDCRIEIYRPRSSKKYRAKLEEGHDGVEIQSARLRIVIAEEQDLDHFLHWYKKLNPNAEIRPDDRLGSVHDFHEENSESDLALRREIEDRARRFAPVAPVAVMTLA